MKNFKTISKGLVTKISAVCLIALGLSSCIKNNDNTPVQPVALLSVIQASPDEPSVDFNLNGTRVNALPISYGSGLDYFRAIAGKRTASFTKTSDGSTVKTDTMTFNQNVAYTLCLVNKAATPEYLKLTDAITQPTSGNANLRFVNLSPDSGPVDLAVKDGAVLVANKPFKGFSDFSSATAKNYTFEVRQAGTTTVLASVTQNINPGFVYSVYFRGLAASTDAAKPTVSLVVNAIY